MEHELNFSKKIIDWYQQHGRKTLPWQIKKTPYTIWISEIMLQQTQIARVIPYFQKFINKFPNIKKIAISKLDIILNLWSGLGYYARAYNIYQTAKIIVNEYKSIFPKDINILMTLPGIGRSTAGAILSLSLEQCHPILDSNVKRILTRYYRIHGWPGNNKTEKKLWSLITQIMPNTNISKFNQGLMDLGETICTIKYPKCTYCPIKKECQAHLKNEIHLYPEKKNKTIIKEKNEWLLILKYKNKVWIERQVIGKIWGGLFCFPKFLTLKKLYDWLIIYNLNTNQCKTLPTIQHKFTHYSLKITPIILNLNNTSLLLNKKKGLWFNLLKPKIIGFPQPILKILKKIQ